MLAPFREGEVSPSLQTQGFPLPPQRDGSVFFRRRRYTPPETLPHARNAHQTRVFTFFLLCKKMEPLRPSKNSKSKRQLATCPQRPLDMSFCGFPQGGKWERSRPSKNSKSKRQLATCPQRPSKSRRQIALPKKNCKFFEKEFDKTKSLGLYYEKLETFPVTFPKIGCKQFFWRKI